MTPLVERIGWTLIHSLWEITLVWAALGIGLNQLRHRSSQARYIAGCVALAAAVLLPYLTFLRLDPAARFQSSREAPVSAVVGNLAPTAAPMREVHRISLHIESWLAQANGRVKFTLPWITLLWAFGSSWNLLRLATGLGQVRSLAHAPRESLPAALEKRCREVAKILGVRRVIQFGESLWVDTPSVVGWLKPVILVPVGVLAGLSALQIDALMAHELAHIRRHDFLVNFLQSIAGALFFYHPAIQAINRYIRRERENACDDIAVSMTGDALDLATALAHLEDVREPGLVLAATAGGDLLGRIRRLIGDPATSGDRDVIAAGRAKTWSGPRFAVGLSCAFVLMLLPLTSFGQNQISVPDRAPPMVNKSSRLVGGSTAVSRALTSLEVAADRDHPQPGQYFASWATITDESPAAGLFPWTAGILTMIGTLFFLVRMRFAKPPAPDRGRASPRSDLI